MRAGRLKNRITIEDFVTTQDPQGNIIQEWQTFATARAAIMPVRGREFFEARAINTETTVRFVIRYLSGVTEDMRIKDEDDNLYDIQAILHTDHGRRELEIMATQTSGESA